MTFDPNNPTERDMMWAHAAEVAHYATLIKHYGVQLDPAFFDYEAVVVFDRYLIEAGRDPVTFGETGAQLSRLLTDPTEHAAFKARVGELADDAVVWFRDIMDQKLAADGSVSDEFRAMLETQYEAFKNTLHSPTFFEDHVVPLVKAFQEKHNNTTEEEYTIAGLFGVGIEQAKQMIASGFKLPVEES